MPKSYTSTALTALLLAALAGCGGADPEPTPSAPTLAASSPAPSPAAPSPGASSPASSSPAASSPTAPSPTSTATAPPVASAFPLAITRRGGFAGVEDRAEITANGTVVVTSRDRPAAKTSLPKATVAELSRLVTSPDLAGRVEVPTCNDGFEYEVATPKATVTVHDCGQPHGAPIDRILEIAVPLLNK